MSLSLSYWVIWLCLLLFSFLHACHSCSLAMRRERNALHPTSHIIASVLLFHELFVSPCMMMSLYVFLFSCIPRSPVIMLPPVVMVAPSKQSGMSSFSCLWHGLTHIWSGRHDGLHGCQWKSRWAVSGVERGGSRDLHDCVQEPLGSGKRQHLNQDSRRLKE